MFDKHSIDMRNPWQDTIRTYAMYHIDQSLQMEVKCSFQAF